MHTGRYYSLPQTLLWTRTSIILFTFTSAIPVFLYKYAGLHWLAFPWYPIAIIGTAVAFYLGFKNNSSYDRTWEARKIWGAIVNSSRSWGIMVIDYITNLHATEKLGDAELKQIHTRLIYRHIAWLTALRHQLRASRTWEHNNKKADTARDFLGTTFDGRLTKEDFDGILSEEEVAYFCSKKNAAAQIIKKQSTELKELRAQGYIDDFRHVEMENMLVDLYTQQGKSERIKNFPFPRQYATMNLFFVWLFMILVPFGMLDAFNELGENFVWLTVPFSVIVCWVFHTMEMIGDYSENPFEGLWNDVPINNIARGIEIDLRDMLDEEDLPEPLVPKTNFKVVV
jgi:putative membrane protein